MARVNKEGENGGNAAASTGDGQTASTAVADTKSADSRFRKVKNPDTGEFMNRKDFILLRADQGKSRSEITKEIQGFSVEDGGDPKFRYQIVFQTTKALTAEKYPHLRAGHQKKAAPVAAAGDATQTPAT